MSGAAEGVILGNVECRSRRASARGCHGNGVHKAWAGHIGGGGGAAVLCAVVARGLGCATGLRSGPVPRFFGPRLRI